jgi:dienelactone hydrolase
VTALTIGAALPAAGATAPIAASTCTGTGTGVVDGPTPDALSAAGTIRLVETLVDPTRSTEETTAIAASPCRVLPVAVHLPDGATGPLPLIVVVHGRDGDPRSLRPLLDTWTTAGYVVAAPTFPVTRKDPDDKPRGEEVERQTGDVRFVIDELLDQSRDPTSPLFGSIDAAHIGVVGMSLGGMTVYGLISNTCCRDPRGTAAISMAGVYRAFPHGRYVRRHVPVLLVQGDADKGYHNSVEAYPKLALPKWFITLHGSLHSPPFEVPRGQAGLGHHLAPDGVVAEPAKTEFGECHAASLLRSTALTVVRTPRGVNLKKTIRQRACRRLTPHLHQARTLSPTRKRRVMPGHRAILSRQLCRSHP